MRAVLDSDILVDYLQGLDKAKREIERYSQPEISIISWMEIMTGADNPAEEKSCRDFLSRFFVHQLSIDIATEAVAVRKKYRIRLPDAIIWATARANGCLLVTRNTKDFSTKEPEIRVPYRVT